MIRKLPKKRKWRLYSIKKVKGKRRNLGTFPSLKKAIKHERDVQFFKHRK